jgi:hypothetical protein
MYLLTNEAEESGLADDRIASLRGLVLLYDLGEPERGVQVLPWIFGGLYSAIRQPSVVVDKFGRLDPEALTSAQRQVLLLALFHSGRCVDVPPILAHLQLETRETFGDAGQWDSPYTNAILLAWCLRESDAPDRARALAEKLIAYTHSVEHENLHIKDYGQKLAALQVIVGDLEGATGTLRKMWDANGLLPWRFFRYSPQYRDLEGLADFQQLRDALQTKLNAEREKLGWPPKALEDI